MDVLKIGNDLASFAQKLDELELSVEQSINDLDADRSIVLDNINQIYGRAIEDLAVKLKAIRRLKGTEDNVPIAD